MGPDHHLNPTKGSSPSAKGGCRFCGAPLEQSVVDLGAAPPCQNFLTAAQLLEPEVTYPLHVFVCGRCFLVQLEEYVSGESIFGTEYAYFSSYSETWLAHCAAYADMIIDRLGLTPRHKVIEIASNDGYLLKNFVARGIPALGIEPAPNVAEAATAEGVRTLIAFFGTTTAKNLVADGTRADLLIGNNVLAHVPDLNDFVAGIKIALAPAGVATFEFPHLMRLIEGNQFDTIYHEHFCYYSLLAVTSIFEAHGLTIFDVEELPTHGGSLRLYVGHADGAGKMPSPRVDALLSVERERGYDTLALYRTFTERVSVTKRGLLDFLIQAKRDGKTIAGYGAPGKGNTLLNYCGVRTDFIDYVVDRNPYKQGRFLPGARIPIFPPERLAETKPDYVLILPWNLREEIAAQIAYVREWGAKLVVPIPTLEVF